MTTQPAEVDRQLAEVREEQRRRDKLQDILSRVRGELALAEARLGQLRQTLEKEGSDVGKLEKMSFTNLMVSLFGDKDRRLDKERKEQAAAELSYDQHLETVSAIRAEAATIQEQLRGVDPELDTRHRELMAEKERLLLQEPSEIAHELSELAARMADTRSEARELSEALAAGGDVASALEEVRKQLDSASNWGVVDMVGGGLITTMIKHGKLDAAKQAATAAQRQLSRFNRELRDVEVRAGGLEADLGAFDKFADYLLDGLLFDWLVQSKISRARKDVDRGLGEVQKLLTGLRARRDATTRDLEELARRRTEILGAA